MFWVENKSYKEPKRFLVYCRAIQIDPDSYIETGMNENTIALSEKFPIKLIVQKHLISSDELNDFRKMLQNCKFDPKHFKLDDSHQEFELVPRPSIIQFDAESLNFTRPPKPPESGLNVMARVETYWPMNKIKLIKLALELNSNHHQNITEIFLDDIEFEKILFELVSQMQKFSGLSFKEAYSERIGNIEIFDVPFNAHLKHIPFQIETDKDLDTFGEPVAKGVVITWKSTNSFRPYWVNVILQNNDEIITDTLRSWETEQPLHVSSEEILSGYEIRIYDATPENKLVYQEKAVLLRMLIGSGQISSGSKKIKDSLSTKLANHKIEIGEKIEESSSFAHTSFKSGGYQKDPWVLEARSTRQFIQDHVVLSQNSKWFSRGLTEQGECLEYIRNIIDDTKNSEVLIVDPFFGETAFGLLIPRLKYSGLLVTVITSCLGLNPDSETLPDKVSEIEKVSQQKQQRDRIENWCNKHSALIAVNLQIICVGAGQDGLKQAFHDRYIACVQEGRPVVYSLSNSINKLAGNYPCLITKLEPQISKKIFRYLRGLENGLDFSKKESDKFRELKKDVIWNMKIAREKRQEIMTSSHISKENQIIEFPAWRTFLSIMLDLKGVSDSELIKHALEAGYLNNERKWQVPDSFTKSLAQAFSRCQDDLEIQSKFFAALGEIRAHASIRKNGNDLDREVIKYLENNRESVNVIKILGQVQALYQDTPPPYGVKELAPTIEELSLENYLKARTTSEEDEIYIDPLDLMRNAERILDSIYMLGVSRLYGLKWTIKIFLIVCIKQTLEWIEIDNNRTTQSNAAIIKAIADAFLVEQSMEFSTDLIKSKVPFISMFGVAGLYFRKSYHKTKKKLETQSQVISELKKVGFSDADILWMSGLQLSEAQSSVHRAIDQFGQNSPEVEESKTELDKMLKVAGDLLAKSSPDEQQIKRLNSTIGHSTKDRLTIAEYAENQQDKNNKKSWILLYKQCVEDVDVLIGKVRDEDFHFYARTDFEKLIAAAKAFFRLNEGNTLRRLRNLYQNYLEKLAIDVSDPLAPIKNYHRWNESLGRAAAGLLFAIYICGKSSSSNENADLSLNLMWIIKAVCQLFIGAKKGWYDIAGLLDRLAQETAWSISSIDDPEIQEIARRAAKDERLPLFFRACMCIMPTNVFKSDYKLGLKLIFQISKENPKDPKTLNQYFYLLDYIIGNGFKTKLDRAIVSKSIEHGFSIFTQLNESWKTFYEIAWDALSGDQDSIIQIVNDSIMKSSYVGFLLQSEEKNA